MNDLIHLTERINNDWMRGRLNSNKGMFPVNFVNIVVPLEESSSESSDNYKYVIALYTFTPETWDDLAFQVILIFSFKTVKIPNFIILP